MTDETVFGDARAILFDRVFFSGRVDTGDREEPPFPFPNLEPYGTCVT